MISSNNFNKSGKSAKSSKSNIVTTIRSHDGKITTIPNTSQNLYINSSADQTGGKQKNTSNKHTSNKHSSNKHSSNSDLDSDSPNDSPNDSDDSYDSDNDSDIKTDNGSDANSETDNISTGVLGGNTDGDVIDADIEDDDIDVVDELGDEDSQLSDNDNLDDDEQYDDEQYDDVDIVNVENETDKRLVNDDDNTIDQNGDEIEDDCLYTCDDIIDIDELNTQPREVPNKERKTDNELLHYEKVRILGVRTKQIEMGSKVMLKYDTNSSFSPLELAKHELANGTTPFIVKRPLPNHTYELWKISELTHNEDNTQYHINNLNKSFNDNINSGFLSNTYQIEF